MKSLKVCWISAGVSSFIAGYLERNTIDEYIYIDISDQHCDSIRFIKDAEKCLGKQIKILKSEQYNSVEEAVRAMGWFQNGITHFAPCTNLLKKRVRKQWEQEHADYNLTYVWGLDCNETKRAERIVETMIEYEHQFPLIDKHLTKESAHAICKNLGLKRPMMYDLGYNNNNCVGCIKGGMGYWNKIRIDFPDVFEKRAKLERIVGHTILKDSDGTPIYLDDLSPERGRMPNEVMTECDLFCTSFLPESE